MPSTVKLLFIAGSVRQGSYNKRLAMLAAEIAEANGLNSHFADLRDFPLPLYDGDLEKVSGPPDNAHRLKAIFSAHHGIFIAAPEYNASITPLLKNALDWVSRVRVETEAPLQVYRTRPFALGSASPGGFGGMRGLIVLRQTLTLGLGAVVLPEQISVPRANEAFDQRGHLQDKGQQELLKAMLQKLANAARVMKV
jgi:chromate reductase, NAD(P)H dehydrogenase (quinone)